MKKRVLFYTILPYLQHKNALVITGMRQVGKTTLLRQLFEKVETPKLWFDFDNPLDQKVFEDINYRTIYTRLQKQVETDNEHRLTVFLDEIQNFPEITKVMKYLIDHYGVKFIVTGSSNFYLKNLFPESLSGRKFLYELPPLSFQELLYFKEQISLTELQQHTLEQALSQQFIEDVSARQELYAEYLQYGGFPEVVLTDTVDEKKLILKNIFASFFEKDVQFLSDLKDIRELRDLLLLLAPRVGSLLDVSRIASELGVDRKKIYYYLELLQGTFFLRLISKFSHSIDRSVAGGKKVYFTDVGLLHILGTVNEGQTFENAIVNQIALFGDLHFYNKRNTAEIDIILDKKIGFEVKTTATDKDQKKVEKIAQNIGITETYVISKNSSKAERVVYGSML